MVAIVGRQREVAFLGEALAQLKDIYTKKRRWEALFDLLAREAELASDPDARLAKKIEMAGLRTERLHQNAIAIGLWKEILDEAPETTQALDMLENLAEREKDWETLAGVLQSRAEVAETVSDPGEVDGEVRHLLAVVKP